MTVHLGLHSTTNIRLTTPNTSPSHTLAINTPPLLTMKYRWPSFRKRVQGFLKLRPYQRHATPSPAVAIHPSPVPLTGASLTSFNEELCILRQELTDTLSEQDNLNAEYDISPDTIDDAIHDINRRLSAVESIPPSHSFQDTSYLPNCQDAELRELEGLIAKMRGWIEKMGPLTQRRTALSKQVSVRVDADS